MMREFEENIVRQGLSMDVYYQYMGTNEETMRETFKDTSMKSVDARLMLEAIAKAENLVISDEDLDAEVIKYGESYGVDGKTMLDMIQEEGNRRQRSHQRSIRSIKKATKRRSLGNIAMQIGTGNCAYLDNIRLEES